MNKIRNGFKTAVVTMAIAGAMAVSAPAALADTTPGTPGAGNGTISQIGTGVRNPHSGGGDVLSAVTWGIDKIFEAFQNNDRYKSFVNEMLNQVDQDTNYKYNIVVVYLEHDFGAKNVLTGNLQGGPGINNTPLFRSGTVNGYSYGVYIFDRGTADFQGTLAWMSGPSFTASTSSNGGIHGNATPVGPSIFGPMRGQLQFTSRSSPHMGGNSMLSSGQTLSKGQQLVSSNGHTLAMQDDGNLVEYADAARTRVLHASNTVGRGDHLTMQWDGNLVLSTANNTPLWSTGTNNNQNAWVQIQDDGNLVLHRSDNSVLWAITPNGWPQTNDAGGGGGGDLGTRGAGNNGQRGNHPDGSWITIVNQGSGRAVDDSAGGTADGNKVQAWGQHNRNEPPQGWRLDLKEKTSDGMPTYALTSRVKDGQVLNLSGADNRSAQLYHYDSTDNSKWLFVSKGDGWYEIYSANKRNDCLTDNGHGNTITVEPCNGRAEQRWGTYLY
ncbi:RICIN domain-containing protein [Streptomyces katrae]|uniref:RICIN domain-containing protein n=1 Tax=Streptomyces katrae TaxID=68223 RepID=A0ABT7GRG5_9ACTN|nr:RICIN domain-containing protein [Streptomyces katrae]MDK9495484.1 RICIN domain-containing protein [Streptomyces katrae]